MATLFQFVACFARIEIGPMVLVRYWIAFLNLFLFLFVGNNPVGIFLLEIFLVTSFSFDKSFSVIF